MGRKGKPKLFGHLLAHKVASNNAIDPGDGVEPVQSLSPNAGFCDIVIEKKKKAVEEAKKHRTGHVLWVDGSKLSQGNAAAAVCWKDKEQLDSWKNSSIFLGMNKEIIDVELWAIAIGLDIARKTTLQSPETAVTIFSDSREALNALGQLSVRNGTPYTRNLIYQNLSDLGRKGKSVTLRWIPGHMGLVGHDKADQIARKKAQKGGKPVEQ